MRRWPVKKPIPNICPSCEGPLSERSQCISKDCGQARNCDHCGRLLNAYGVCMNRFCLRSVCDICQVYLDVYGSCPSCEHKQGQPLLGPSMSPDDPVFTSPTDKPDAPQIMVCETCGKSYEAVLASCPSCTERVTGMPDDPFEGREIHQRLTIPCPPGEHPYDVLASGIKTAPRKSSSPAVEVCVSDAADLETWEAEELLKEDSHD